jgi:hypothetical protein
MSYLNKVKTTLCQCGRTMMSGRHQQYNARVNGKMVCADCYIDEIYKSRGVEA